MSSGLQQTLETLHKVVVAAKKKTQNTSLDKYELLWDVEGQLKDVPVETVKALQGKFMNLFIKEIILQDPTPPLRRVVSQWIVKLCSISGAVSHALTAIKAFQSILTQKASIIAKISALECMGMIYKGLGVSVASAASDSVNILIKQIKSNTPDKRSASVATLRNILEGTGSSGTFLHTVILKNVKQIISDKEANVRVELANLLGAIGSHCSPQNFDALLSYSVKLCEDPSPHARSAAASAIGSCLVVAHEISVSNSKKKEVQPNGPPQKDWTLKAALEYLNITFLKAGSGKKELRAGITLAVVSYLQQLPTRIIRSEMGMIIEKILSLLLNRSMKFFGSLHELLQAHLCTGHMLNDGLRDRLGEEGQKKMAETLIDVISTDGYNEYVLILALRQLSYLFLDLGQGAGPLWDKVELPLSKLLSHQSYSVRGVCAITARSLATALPDYHSNLLRAYLNVTTMEFAQLASCKAEEVKFHLGPLQGNAYAVAGLISIIPHSVLGVPNTITKYSLKKAKELTKIDPSCKFAAMVVARTEAGWSMISALMTLGPAFVERKLVDILDMWDSCFHAMDKVQPTTEKAVVVFSRLKSCALEALCNFFRYNESLLVSDIVERAVFWLKNILEVLTKLPKLTNCQGSTTDIINVLKSNVVKSFASLPVSAYPNSYVPLMTWVIHELPRNATTSLFRSLLQEEDAILGPWLIGKELRDAKLVQSPAVVVHDHSVVWSSDPEKELTNPLPTSKRLVDEILDLFPKLYMVQSAEHQKTIILHLIRCVKESPPELKNSLQTNVFCLLLKTLRVLNEKKQPFPKGKFLKPLLLFIESYLSSSDVALRRAAAECIGLMAFLQGDKFTDHIINSITQTLKVSKDNLTKAGCGFSLACIIRKLGGMRSAYHLPATVSILHVLAKNSSPLVHVWALHSLWITIETTSLSFAPFANPTLSLALSLMLSPDCTTSSSYQSIGRMVNACVSCLGPELQPDSSSFKTCRAMVSEFQENVNPLIQLEGIHFKQMLSLFAPQTVKASECLPFLRNHLQSRFSSLRSASVICLRQLIQIDSKSIQNAEGEGLEEQLLRMLDREREVDLRNELQLLLFSMIEYIGPSRVPQYLELFRTIIASSTSRRGASAPGKDSGTNASNVDDDEEEEGVDASGQLTQVAEVEEDDSVFVPRWRTRVFCMECIGNLIDVVANEKSTPAHFDMILVNKLAAKEKKDDEWGQSELNEEIARKYLVFHLQDLVTVSFNCSTSAINALRPVGVKVLQNIVEQFADAEDPHYEGHKLLELYSAQVAAALRPAFHKDRSPLLTAAATDVVVSFVRNTITAEVSALQKVTRLLTSFIDDVESLEYPSYSEKASTMVQLKILGAIAKLYDATLPETNTSSSSSGTLLSEIIDPFLGKLCRLWMLVLRDWAVVSTQPTSVQKSFKGTFYNFSSTAFVMDYYRAVRSDILLAQASMLNSKHWKDSSFEEQKQNSPKASFEDFSLLVGLCLACLVDCSDSESDMITVLDACSILFSDSSFLTPQLFPLEQWQELLDALQMQMQIGSSTIKCAVIRVLAKITKSFPEEYFQDPNKQQIAKTFLHTLMEVALLPLQGNSTSRFNEELVSCSLSCSFVLPKLLQRVSLETHYTPIVCFLIQNNITKFSESLLPSALSVLSLFIQADKSPKTLSSCVHALLALRDEKSLNIIPALITLITSNVSVGLSQEIHEQIFQQVLVWMNGSELRMKEQTLRVLLQWFQSPQDAQNGVTSWYLQKVTGWIICYFLQLNSVPQTEEAFVLDATKILILAHASSPVDSKSAFLSLAIPTLVGLLSPSSTKGVSDFSLKVIQTLGASDPTSFKEIADSLPATHRKLLENAANAQQQQEVQNQRVVSKRKQRAPKKELTLDFSQYE